MVVPSLCAYYRIKILTSIEIYWPIKLHMQLILKIKQINLQLFKGLNLSEKHLRSLKKYQQMDF